MDIKFYWQTVLLPWRILLKAQYSPVQLSFLGFCWNEWFPPLVKFLRLVGLLCSPETRATWNARFSLEEMYSPNAFASHVSVGTSRKCSGESGYKLIEDPLYWEGTLPRDRVIQDNWPKLTEWSHRETKCFSRKNLKRFTVPKYNSLAVLICLKNTLPNEQI